MYKNKKHLFFDMDDTVTMTRSLMDDDSYKLFQTLPYNIIIVSGAHTSQIALQTRDLKFYRLGQNGNQAIHANGTVLWEETLTEEHSYHIHRHIQQLKEIAPHEVYNDDDLVEHRGAQISYSLIGHHAELAYKKKCDPDQMHRKGMLARIPFDRSNLEVRIGGTTCLDYFEKGKNKGFNVRRLIERMAWNADDAIYFGDALYAGGNDETVIGVIDTVSVKNHRDTYDLLLKHFVGNVL